MRQLRAGFGDDRNSGPLFSDRGGGIDLGPSSVNANLQRLCVLLSQGAGINDRVSVHYLGYAIYVSFRCRAAQI